MSHEKKSFQFPRPKQGPHKITQKEHALFSVYNYCPMRENLIFSQSLLLPQDKKNKHS